MISSHENAPPPGDELAALLRRIGVATVLAANERVIGFAELSSMVPYTRQHIGRLEREGKFPKRIQVGPSRVGWALTEIASWIEERKAARQVGTPPAPPAAA